MALAYVPETNNRHTKKINVGFNVKGKDENTEKEKSHEDSCSARSSQY